MDKFAAITLIIAVTLVLLQAPRDLWEGFSKDFRSLFLKELAQDSTQQDAVRVGLYIAGAATI